MAARDIVIEQALTSEAGYVIDVLQEAAAWLVSQGIPLWGPEELLPDSLRDDVALGLFWIAKIDGVVAGCARLQMEDEVFWPDMPRGQAVYVHRLAVRRKFAGLGVSTALLDWARRHALAEGRDYLRLDCDADRAKLRDFYETYGFRRHSERQVGPYYVIRYEMESS